jgi:hypothetical protein
MVENDRVRTDFHRILEEAPDIGDTKIISNWLFEPPNFFDPKPRKRPKPGIAMAVIYIALMTAVCAAFNFK